MSDPRESLPDGCYREVRIDDRPAQWLNPPRHAQVNTEEVLIKDDAAILDVINQRASQLLRQPLLWNIGNGEDSVSAVGSTATDRTPLPFGEVVYIPALFDALHLAKFYEPFLEDDASNDTEETSLSSVFEIPYIASGSARSSAASSASAPQEDKDCNRYRLPSNQLPHPLRSETNASIRVLSLDSSYVGRRQHLVTFVLLCLFCPNVQELHLAGNQLSRPVLRALCHIILKKHPSLRAIYIPQVVMPFDMMKKLTQAVRDNIRITTLDLGTAEKNKNVLPAQRTKLEHQVARNKEAMRLVEGMRSYLTWTNVPLEPLPDDVARHVLAGSKPLLE